MVNPNKKVKRPDGLGKIYRYKLDDDENILTLPIMKILQDNYVYLYRAVNKENFYIVENDTCFFFKEILYDNEVVGFATYRSSNVNNQTLVMQYIYVLPDYRNKGLLVEELDEASLLFESSIIIEYPNRFIVESLIKHRLARVFDDRFVISKIPFIIPMVSLDEATSGIIREEYDITNKKGYRKLSLIYDLELCAVVGLSSGEENTDFDEDKITDNDDINNYDVLSLPLGIDDKSFHCISKRSNDNMLNNNTYFANIRKLVDNQDDIIQNWLSLL